MRNYYLKIREKFIPDIASGNKTHEYRLASPDRAQIKIGDTLVLISNQDKNVFIKTTIKSIKHFPGWQEALEDNWQKDFKSLYRTMDEALKECYRFYPKIEVDTYGINVYEIEPLKENSLDASILIDTNIIIKRESNNNASFEIANLFNWFAKKQSQIFIHELSKEELNNYDNEEAKKAILTKLNSYNVLPKFPDIKDAFFESIVSQYSRDKNSEIDNKLLKEVYDGNVGVLLTDDNLMLKKAESLYIRDRVLASAELLSKFEHFDPKNIEYKMLAVKLKEFGEVDLNSKFFDTLREDYGGIDFDNWFKRKTRNKEKAYVFENESGIIQGFLYLKDEDPNEIGYLQMRPALSPKRRLKVGTFKIDSTGFRLGERFLKIIFDNAINRNVEEIYVTLFEDRRDDVKQLKEMMESWGFYRHGYKENGELVLVKGLGKYDETKSPKYNFPIIKEQARYFLLPIFPEYHTDLFPDMILKNEDMHLYEDKKAHRYALEKIYLSGAYKTDAKPGDIMVIYRVGESKPKKYSSVITGIAIIESLIDTKSVDECLALCKNRSVFEENEIIEMHKKRPKVVKLLDYKPFKSKVTLEYLWSQGIVIPGNGPRTFDPITKEQYENIYKLGTEK
ncbi:MAG: ASCH domain-containing protein [Bacillota bacterium]|nr:ASCH domain-containing protein [Bacillota bacterium]